MGIGISVLLIAVGAVLTWAVNLSASGLDVDVIGVIMMIAGAIGLVWSAVVMRTGWMQSDGPTERHVHR